MKTISPDKLSQNTSPNSLQRPLRKVLSFVRREGRLTFSQERALKELYPVYGVDLTPALQLSSEFLFNNSQPLILEIGFGMGQSLIQMAKDHPERNYLGIEVHRPGVGHILIEIEQAELKNLKVLCADAVEVIQKHIPDKTLTGVQIFFPDPWHKRKHMKRRLVQENFIKNLIPKLNSEYQSWIHLATDWEDYAKQMMKVMSQFAELENKFGSNQFAPNSETVGRPLTKFQARGERLGHGVWDLVFNLKI